MYARTGDHTTFALFDPLPLISSLLTAVSEVIKVTSFLPVLLNKSGKILFAPQSVFYRAFFSNKSFDKMLTDNPTLSPMDFDPL